MELLSLYIILFIELYIYIYKGTRVLAIHRRRMHAHAYHIEYTDTIVNNITSQSRQRWSECVSRKLALIEIDNLSKKSDSKRFPINKEIAEKLQLIGHLRSTNLCFDHSRHTLI